MSAATSLKNAFEEIGELHESQNNNLKVTLNLGASGDLITQITGSAEVDVFASTALKDMDDLDKSGFVVTGKRTNFMSNSMVLIVPLSTKFTIASLEDLKQAVIRKIAIENPKTVPVGRYTDETFQ